MPRVLPRCPMGMPGKLTIPKALHAAITTLPLLPPGKFSLICFLLTFFGGAPFC